MFACVCLCLREYAGVACVCLYLLGSLVFVRSLLEYAGVCLNFPGTGQVGLSGCGSVGVDYPDATRIHLSFDRIRLDLARMRSGSPGCWPVGFTYPYATRIHLSFGRIRSGRFGRMRAGRGRLPLCGQDPLEFRPDAVGTCADAVRSGSTTLMRSGRGRLDEVR